jgi:hypothetical protein
LTPAEIGVTCGTLGVGTMVAVGVSVGTAVKVGSTGMGIGVSDGMTPAMVGMGEGTWLAGANIGKLQANIRLTDVKNATILIIRMKLSFE